MDIANSIAEQIIPDSEHRGQVLSCLGEIVETYQTETIADLLSALCVSMGDQEQEIESGKINILIMHGAKGLTADLVFIVGAEDEYIPGRQVGEEEWDAR